MEQDEDLSSNADWYGYKSEAAAKASLHRNYPDLMSSIDLIKKRDSQAPKPWGFWVDRTTGQPVSGSLEEVIWQGTFPAKCELKGEPITDKFVDGGTTMGPWAIMCLSCHDKFGLGLGTGKGQLYERREDGEFVKIMG